MTPSRARSAPVDFLRGVAILVVLLVHFTLSSRLAASPLGAVLTPRIANAILLNLIPCVCAGKSSQRAATDTGRCVGGLS
jgi:peptidoglycan/LPS O-acetylase OafA/YrhL